MKILWLMLERLRFGKKRAVALREFVDKHPLGVIATLTVTVAAAATGVVEFFASQRLDLQQDHYQVQLTQITAQYEAKIEDFSRRIASIERRVGDDRKYFDVTSIMLSRDEIPALSSNHESFIKGYLYASPPPDDKWTYSVTNEWEIGKATLPFLAKIFPPEMINDFASWEVHAWKYSSAAEFECELTEPLDECKAYFYPYIYALRVNRDMISKRGKTVLTSLEEAATSKNVDIEEILSAVGDLDKESAEEGDGESASREEILAQLQDLLNEDMANIVLQDRILAGMMMKGLFAGFDYRISSVQKKGNVLYMKGDWMFARGRVSGLLEGDGLIVSEEWFFVGTRDDGLVVRVMVPTLDGRSRAYDWINRWLSDFRVVL